MKKEYKTPVLSIINVDVECLMQVPTSQQTEDEWANSKKGGRFVDDEDIAPAAPKKFWDDEN